MAIDKKRLKEYIRQLEAMLAGLSWEESAEIIQAKLIDYIFGLGERRPSLTELRREVKRMFSPEVQKLVEATFREFSAALDMTNSMYSEIGGAVSRDAARIRTLEKVARTRFGAYEAESARQIAEFIKRDLAKGLNERRLRRHIAEIGGKAQFYAETIARTSLKGYSRAAKLEKARIGDVKYYEYVGIRRAATRPFCLALIGTTHNLTQIRGMSNGQGLPVEIYCGGWNCHHDWEPDPFATESTAGRWQEEQTGKKNPRTIRVFSPRELEIEP